MPTTLSGSKIVLVYGATILAYLRDDKLTIPFPGMWDLPGGGIEPGEDLLTCAYRELEEEFGLHNVDLELLDVVLAEKTKGVRLGRVYGQLTAKHVSAIRFGSEGQRYGFFTIDQIQQINFVPDLRDYIVANQHRLFERA